MEEYLEVGDAVIWDGVTFKSTVYKYHTIEAIEYWQPSKEYMLGWYMLIFDMGPKWLYIDALIKGNLRKYI